MKTNFYEKKNDIGLFRRRKKSKNKSSILLSTFILLTCVYFASCKKEMIENKSAFKEPMKQNEIQERINIFLQKTNPNSMQDRIADEFYSVEETVWNIEAALNYSFCDLSIPILDFVYELDSIQLNIIDNSINVNEVINAYSQFQQKINLKLNNEPDLICRIVDIEPAISGKIIASFVYGIKDSTQERSFSGPFGPTESYYMYLPNFIYPGVLPIPPAGPDNAASKIQNKLLWRNNIAVLPYGSYFVNITGWVPNGAGIAPSTPYYNNPCPGFPGHFKNWGSPGIDALYYGTVENSYVNSTRLNYLVDEAEYRIAYTIPPTGKQVSHIQYLVSHGGSLTNWGGSQNGCFQISYEFACYFRWKYGTLVFDRR